MPFAASAFRPSATQSLPLVPTQPLVSSLPSLGVPLPAAAANVSQFQDPLFQPALPLTSHHMLHSSSPSFSPSPFFSSSPPSDAANGKANFEANADAQVCRLTQPQARGAGGCTHAPQELLDAIAQSDGNAAVDAIAAAAATSAALHSLSENDGRCCQLQQHMRTAGEPLAPGAALAASDAACSLDDKLAIPSLVKRVTQVRVNISFIRAARLKQDPCPC